MKQSLRFTKILLSILLILTITLSLNIQAQSTRTINGKQFLQSNGKWYQKEGSKQYEVNTSVITVKWKSNTTLSQKNVTMSSQGAIVLRSNSLGFSDLRITVPGDVMQIVEHLVNTGLVESAEVNTFGEYVSTPNDTYYSTQWYLNQAYDHDIDIPEAWDLSTGSSSIDIGILDSGTDWAHTDLAGNIWTNSGEDVWSDSNDPGTGNGIDDDGNGLIDDWKGWDFFNNNNDSRGLYYHGTHVAGIVGARSNNNAGISGISGGWGSASGVKMLIAGVGDNYPDGSILDDAILYAAAKGVKVITMSLSVAQTAAIDNALATAYNTYGCFIDCAAGNNYSGPVTYPANNQYVVAVSATDQNDAFASFSNKGSEISVSAPGVDIYSTQLSNSYGSSSGTSFSAPIVAGIASLLYSVNSGLTNAQVKSIIELTAEDKGAAGRDDYYGNGRVNAHRALQTVIAPTNFQNNSSSGYTQLSWSAHPSSILQYYEVLRNVNNWGWVLIATTTNTSYTDQEFNITNPRWATDAADYKIRVKNSNGSYSAFSNAVSVVGNSYYQQKYGAIIKELPTEYFLSSNFPNPFNPSTKIEYALPEPSNVSIIVFDHLGRKVAELVNENKEAGFYSATFDATKLASGVYFYTIKAGSFTASRKMLLLK